MVQNSVTYFMDGPLVKYAKDMEKWRMIPC